jgi:hypothetical protein
VIFYNIMKRTGGENEAVDKNASLVPVSLSDSESLGQSARIFGIKARLAIESSN